MRRKLEIERVIHIIANLRYHGQSKCLDVQSLVTKTPSFSLSTRNALPLGSQEMADSRPSISASLSIKCNFQGNCSILCHRGSSLVFNPLDLLIALVVEEFPCWFCGVLIDFFALLIYSTREVFNGRQLVGKSNLRSHLIKIY